MSRGGLSDHPKQRFLPPGCCGTIAAHSNRPRTGTLERGLTRNTTSLALIQMFQWGRAVHLKRVESGEGFCYYYLRLQNILWWFQWVENTNKTNHLTLRFYSELFSLEKLKKFWNWKKEDKKTIMCLKESLKRSKWFKLKYSTNVLQTFILNQI